MTAPLTTADLLTGIANAIRAHDFPAVADMLRMLATIDPTAAYAVYQVLKAGIAAAPSPQDGADLATALTEAMP